MTTSWLRRPSRHLRYSPENSQTLNKISIWCQWRCRSVMIHLGLNDCFNPQFACHVHLISFMRGVVWTVLSRLSQFVELYLLLHQQKTFPSGRNGSVGVDALHHSCQSHPGGGSLRGRRQYHASRCISPSDRRFAVASRSVGLLF